jgi:hypothetical protein
MQTQNQRINKEEIQEILGLTNYLWVDTLLVDENMTAADIRKKLHYFVQCEINRRDITVYSILYSQRNICATIAVGYVFLRAAIMCNNLDVFSYLLKLFGPTNLLEEIFAYCSDYVDDNLLIETLISNDSYNALQICSQILRNGGDPLLQTKQTYRHSSNSIWFFGYENNNALRIVEKQNRKFNYANVSLIDLKELMQRSFVYDFNESKNHHEKIPKDAIYVTVKNSGNYFENVFILDILGIFNDMKNSQLIKLTIL